MDVFGALIAIFIVDLAAQASPGPSFLLVSRTAVRAGFRHGFANVAGLVVANMVWCAAAVGGLTALLALAPWLHRVLQLLGGAYLIYLGISLWRARPEGAAEEKAEAGSRWRAFASGFLIGVSNPKAIVYFASIFSLFLSPETPAMVRAGAVAIVLCDTAAWFGFVAALFSRPGFQRAYAKVKRSLDRVAGALLAAFGLRLLLARES
jgi:threonine efflux protein